MCPNRTSRRALDALGLSASMGSVRPLKKFLEQIEVQKFHKKGDLVVVFPMFLWHTSTYFVYPLTVCLASRTTNLAVSGGEKL